VGVFVMMYFLARDALGGETPAVGATLALFLFPEIGREWLRERTHLVLVSLAGAGCLLLFLRAARRRTVRNYLFLGLGMGLGFLGNYSFLVFAGALLGGA
jgi:4-amino-4-deoxy-L-arabinose transferase-like glycosyltransferase